MNQVNTARDVTWRILRVVLLGLVAIHVLACETSTAEKSLGMRQSVTSPLHEGYGSACVGGTGSHLQLKPLELEVTNLDDNGSGSLRAAVEQEGPRIVRFKVAGEIVLRSALEIRKPYLTIAGASAPEGGILLQGSVQVRTHNVHLDSLRIMAGEHIGNKMLAADELQTRDSLVLWGEQHDDILLRVKEWVKAKTPAQYALIPESSVFNIVVSNSTIAFGVDENLSTYNAVSHVSIHNNIIAYGLNRSRHPKVAGSKHSSHSMAMLIGTEAKRISIFRNVFAHNYDRNPRILQGADGGPEVQVINNLIVNPGPGLTNMAYSSTVDTDQRKAGVNVDYIGNVLLSGKDTPPKKALVNCHPKELCGNVHVFVEGNQVPKRLLGGAKVISGSFAGNLEQESTVTEQGRAIETLSGDQVLSSLGAFAGVRGGSPHPVEKRVRQDIERLIAGKLDQSSAQVDAVHPDPIDPSRRAFYSE